MMKEPSRTIFQVVTAQLALESLRAKDSARALEVLELLLDIGVLKLDGLAKECDSDERNYIRSFLRQVRAYRESHPRRVESDLSTVANGAIVRAIQVSKERVSEILDEAE